MAKILLSAFADEYSSDIDIQIKMLKEHHLNYIEPRFINGKNIAELSEREAKDLKEKLGDIRVSSIGSPLGKINLADDFQKHLEMVRRVCETACILDTSNIRMFSFYLHQGKTRQECREEVIDKVGQMLEVARNYEVNLCHENEAGIYGESPECCHDLLKTFQGELKCVFDMGNFVLDGFKPYPDAYELLKPYIQYFHIKDALHEGAIVPPGCGEGMIKEIISQYIRDFNKDVIVTLEPHLETFDGLNALVGKQFENPYKYETAEAAFLAALRKIKEIISWQ